MKTALGIFLHDLKTLVRNPFALVVALGLIVLPSVYAWYSVAAMWSPYSHTDGLKVAVVSEDAGVSIDGIRGIDAAAVADELDDSGKLNVGDLIVDAMRQNGDFDWQFVDAAQGESGLASGEYYAEFVLPESFSQDFLGVLKGDLDRPVIEYWVNEKYNAVALEVTDAGAGIVDSIVNRIFSAVVSDSLSSVVEKVASGILETGRSSSSQVSTGLDGAKRDLSNVEANLGHTGSSIERWRKTVADARDTLDSLKKSAPSLREALDDGRKLLSDARTSAHKVENAYSSVLSQGGKELASVLKQIAESVSSATAVINSKQKEADAALGKIEDVLEESERLIAALRKADPDSGKLANLEKQIGQLAEHAAELGEANAAVAAAAEEAEEETRSVSDDISESASDIKDRNSTFNSKILPKVDTSLDSLALIMGTLDGALGSLDAQIDQAKTLLEQLDSVLTETDEALNTTTEALETAQDSIDSARSDLSALANSRTAERVSDLAGINVKSYGSFMASPVNAEIKQVYPLNSYGSGVAPFYTNLAIWVGCFMLIAVLKLEVDPELFPKAKPWQGYIGRLLLFGALALLQGVVVTAGDMVLGVQAVSPVAFVAAGLVVAFCFINVVYALAVTFKHVGKALAVVFLIVQIPGASGMYPVQLMPEFFQALYPWLPFTYGMGAMREAIGGFYDGSYARCLIWLLVCGLAALAIALLIRPRVLNLNRLFDRKLESADVFIAEEHGFGNDTSDDRPVIDALLADDRIRPLVLMRARRFEERYAVIKQAAPLAIVALTVALGLVSFLLGLGSDGKLVVLTAFIAAVVLVFFACVAFEYVHDNVARQAELLEADAAAMPGIPFAPIEPFEMDGSDEADWPNQPEEPDTGTGEGPDAPAESENAGEPANSENLGGPEALADPEETEKTGELPKISEEVDGDA